MIQITWKDFGRIISFTRKIIYIKIWSVRYCTFITLLTGQSIKACSNLKKNCQLMSYVLMFLKFTQLFLGKFCELYKINDFGG